MKNRAPLWAIAGVIAALVFAPAAAIAATTLVTISGGGNQAWVDKSHRVQAAEADPANLVNVSATASVGCQPVYTVPTGKHLIIKTMDFVAPNGNAANAALKVYANGTCSGPAIAGSDLFFGSSCCSPSDHVDFGEGAVVGPGQVVGVSNNNTLTDVYLHGYLVPGNF